MIENKKDLYSYIKNVVDLEVGISELNNQTSLMLETIYKLKNEKNKDDLIKILLRIRSDLEQAKKI